jgi:hypothetical protein
VKPRIRHVTCHRLNQADAAARASEQESEVTVLVRRGRSGFLLLRACSREPSARRRCVRLALSCTFHAV